MKKKLFDLIFLFLISFCVSNAYGNQIEKIFYLIQNKDNKVSQEVLDTIERYSEGIDVLAPQIYIVDEYGNITGDIDTQIIDIAKKFNIKILPLFTNLYFNSEKLHNFLNNEQAQTKAIQNMIQLCKKYNFYGLQIDFEHILSEDGSKFTFFFHKVANALHKNSFYASVAVLPRPSTILNSNFDRWYFENWSGAYDYKKLGESADFVTLMSYPQHISLTTPGPLAALDWVEANLNTILKEVPKNKISLGIPTYSTYWFTGTLEKSPFLLDLDKIPEEYTYRGLAKGINYANALKILVDNNLSLIWNPQWASYYTIYHTSDYMNQFIFLEDAKSFSKKIELMEKYNLRGIAVWRLGYEDPAIWKNRYLSHPNNKWWNFFNWF